MCQAVLEMKKESEQKKAMEIARNISWKCQKILKIKIDIGLKIC